MLRMMRDRVLVLPIERKLSDVILVKNSEKFNLGTVVAVGPGRIIKDRLVPTTVKVGDVVRYGEFEFAKYSEGGIAYQIIQEADIAAIVEDQAA